MLEEKSEIQLSLRVSWKKEKNEFGDNLIVKIHKDGSVLESRIENAIPKITIRTYLVRLFQSHQILQSIMK